MRLKHTIAVTVPPTKVWGGSINIAFQMGETQGNQRGCYFRSEECEAEGDSQAEALAKLEEKLRAELMTITATRSVLSEREDDLKEMIVELKKLQGD